jgi:hypothetical protein
MEEDFKKQGIDNTNKTDNVSNNNPSINTEPQQARAPQPFLFPQDLAPGSVVQQHLVPNPSSKGDIYFGLDGVRFARIAIGKIGQVLTVASGVPAWSYLLTTGIASARPTTGAFTGAQFFATDTKVLSIWDGATWRTTTLT